MLERDSGRFHGRAGRNHCPHSDEIELGRELRPDVWGNGYATKAVRA